MNKILFLIILYSPILQAKYFCPPVSNPNESAKQAYIRFEHMTARQIDNICIHDLTSNQLQEFKALAQHYFHTEIVTPGCDSQANRIKYVIMYQKIGGIKRLVN